MKQVYVHGLGQTPSSWEKIISKVKGGENSICPNLAEIMRNKEVSYRNLYKEFSAVCDEIEEPIKLCGLSLGGVMALNYAIDHPEKINSLILIAAQYKMPKKMLQFQNIIFRFMPKSMFKQMGFGKAEFIQLCKTMMELDFGKELYKIKCPILIVYGEKDKANKEASIELAGILEKAELQVVIGSGHEINIDKPEQLAKIIDDFFESKRECKEGDRPNEYN